jgi:hypothetical protein
MQEQNIFERVNTLKVSQINMYTYVGACIICTYVYIYIYTHTHTHTRVCVCVCVCVHINGVVNCGVANVFVKGSYIRHEQPLRWLT